MEKQIGDIFEENISAMCYDVSFAAGVGTITQYFLDLDINQVDFDTSTMLHVQAQAYRKYPVIICAEKGLQLQLFEWGIIPEYFDTPEKIKKGRSSMCNARSEKIIDDKHSYWHRIRNKRCLIPVTGIFEHREVKGFKNKIPYFIRLRSRDMFCLPALYHYPHKADVETGEVTGTFSVVTRAANELMSKIHNSGDQAFRMPLFLPKELELKWLGNNLSDEEFRSLLEFEMPSEELQYHPVFTIRTTKERPDGLSKIDPYKWTNLPEPGEENNPLSLF